MLLYILLLFIFGVVVGMYTERYRWAHAAKTRKSIGVDGLFYRVSQFDPDNNQEKK